MKDLSTRELNRTILTIILKRHKQIVQLTLNLESHVNFRVDALFSPT
jgi:hypothetical protein